MLESRNLKCWIFVWKPYLRLQALSHSLDSIQAFAIKLASKFHSLSLLPSLIPPSLSSRRLHARLKLLFAFSKNIFLLFNPPPDHHTLSDPTIQWTWFPSDAALLLFRDYFFHQLSSSGTLFLLINSISLSFLPSLYLYLWQALKKFWKN